MELTNKVALVTGAGAGIGRSTAQLLAEYGTTAVIVDRDGDAADAVADAIKAAGGQALAIDLDLADTARSAGLVDQIVGELGRLDILINNAGITGAGGLLDLSEAAFDLAVKINLKSPFLLTQAFGRHVAQRGGGGKVVNLAQ